VTTFQCLVVALWPAILFIVLQLMLVRTRSTLAESIETLERDLNKVEMNQIIVGDEPQWARDNRAFVHGQEIIIQVLDDLRREDFGFKAIFLGVKEGPDSRPLIVFQVGEGNQPERTLLVSRVIVSICEPAEETSETEGD